MPDKNQSDPEAGIIQPGQGEPAAIAATPDALPVSARAFIEENPRLCREAQDVIALTHLDERHTREAWTEIAKAYGGNR